MPATSAHRHWSSTEKCFGARTNWNLSSGGCFERQDDRLLLSEAAAGPSRPDPLLNCPLRQQQAVALGRRIGPRARRPRRWRGLRPADSRHRRDPTQGFSASRVHSGSGNIKVYRQPTNAARPRPASVYLSVRSYQQLPTCLSGGRSVGPVSVPHYRRSKRFPEPFPAHCR